MSAICRYQCTQFGPQAWALCSNLDMTAVHKWLLNYHLVSLRITRVMLTQFCRQMALPQGPLGLRMQSGKALWRGDHASADPEERTK